MNFLHTPYESGVSLREDIFNKQFTVNVTGIMIYPEYDPRYGIYEQEETLIVCESATVSNAAARLLQIYESAHWPIRDTETDYYAADLGHDCGPVEFYPHTVKILNRHHELVLGGDFSSPEGINWFPPVTNAPSLARLKTQQQELFSLASTESAWDNYETARSLRRDAELLSLYFAHKKYAYLPEIKYLISEALYPSLQGR